MDYTFALLWRNGKGGACRAPLGVSVGWPTKPSRSTTRPRTPSSRTPTRERAQLAEWIAEELGQPYQATNVDVALATDLELAGTLTPRELPGGKFGVVLDDTLKARIREALRA